MIITDPKILGTVSSDVTQDEIAGLEKLLLDEVKNHKDAAGLAAIQLGVPKRLFIAFDDVASKWVLWVNPQIEQYEDEKIEVVEGCLSFPLQHVLTKRHKQILVSAQSLENWPERERFALNGMDSVIFQHELDHLNGKLMFDRGTRYFGKTAPFKSENKIGRNDLCPCGSGKKYKKCCSK